LCRYEHLCPPDLGTMGQGHGLNGLYRCYLHARDAVLLVLHQERGPLMALGVELGPPGVQVASVEPIQPVALAHGAQVWRAQVFVAARREL
ncbi:hypothetical protein CSW50_06805, partial [Thermus scotoductus]